MFELCALYTSVRCRVLTTGPYADLYCALRWNYRATDKLNCWQRHDSLKLIRSSLIQVSRADRSVFLRPVDWGPAEGTDRLIDVSPLALSILNCNTDDIVTVQFTGHIVLR